MWIVASFIPAKEYGLSGKNEVSKIATSIKIQGSIAMRKTPSEEYLEKAKLLTKEDTERLLARMRSKIIRKLEDTKLSTLEAVAIQLEIEDEELNEWREKRDQIRKKTKSK
jgi:hypothetical protein